MAWPQSSATQTLSTVTAPVASSTLDLDHLRRVAEAHGRADRAAAVLAALRFRRTGEGALHGDRAVVDQRGFHDVGERQGRLLACADAELLADAFDILGRASSLRAAASIRIAFSFFAASIAAFPTMKVMREE